MGADYYGVLGVDKKADDAELKKGTEFGKLEEKIRSIDRASVFIFSSSSCLSPRSQ